MDIDATAGGETMEIVTPVPHTLCCWQHDKQQRNISPDFCAHIVVMALLDEKQDGSASRDLIAFDNICSYVVDAGLLDNVQLALML